MTWLMTSQSTTLKARPTRGPPTSPNVAITRLQDAACETARALRDVGELDATDSVIEQALKPLDQLSRAQIASRVNGERDMRSGPHLRSMNPASRFRLQDDAT